METSRHNYYLLKRLRWNPGPLTGATTPRIKGRRSVTSRSTGQFSMDGQFTDLYPFQQVRIAVLLMEQLEPSSAIRISNICRGKLPR